MILSAIQSDLRRILLAIPGRPAEIQWQGMPFEPSTGVEWLSESLEPLSSETATLGAFGETEENLRYNLDLRYPVRRVKDAHDAADAIRAAFHAGRFIGSAGPVPIAGSVRKAELRRPVPGEVWYLVPVRIEFYVRRPTIIAA